MAAFYRREVLIMSYLSLRKTIGYIAISIPFLLVVGSVLVGNCPEIQSSISDYYHTQMRDVLVGTLCAIALFLFCYTGYDRYDVSATRLAAIFALGVALFPTGFNDSMIDSCHAVRQVGNPIVARIHLISAFCLFVTLSIISLFLFTKSDRPKWQWGPNKKRRNRVYRRSAYVMLTCLALLVGYFSLKGGSLQPYIEGTFVEYFGSPEWLALMDKIDIIFWLETVMLFAFGISWLTKGKIFFKDRRVQIY
jgi:hypothetical protein